MSVPKFLLLGIVVVFASGSGCLKNPNQAVDASLQGTDCITYDPPRGDRGPGSIFQRRHIQGKTIDHPVCENLYPTDRSREAGLSLEQQDASSTYDASFTANLLAGLVKNIEKTSANLGANGVTFVTVKWGITKVRSLPAEVKFDKKGKLLPLSNQCAAALRELKDSNRLDDVYMVQSAVLVESLLVTTNTESNKNAGVDINFRRLLDFNPNLKVTEKDLRTLEIKEPRYICAYPPIHITEFIPRNALGTESAVVKGEPITNDQWRALNSR